MASGATQNQALFQKLIDNAQQQLVAAGYNGSRHLGDSFWQSPAVQAIQTKFQSDAKALDQQLQAGANQRGASYARTDYSNALRDLPSGDPNPESVLSRITSNPIAQLAAAGIGIGSGLGMFAGLDSVAGADAGLSGLNAGDALAGDAGASGLDMSGTLGSFGAGAAPDAAASGSGGGFLSSIGDALSSPYAKAASLAATVGSGIMGATGGSGSNSGTFQYDASGNPLTASGGANFGDFSGGTVNTGGIFGGNPILSNPYTGAVGALAGGAGSLAGGGSGSSSSGIGSILSSLFGGGTGMNAGGTTGDGGSALSSLMSLLGSGATSAGIMSLLGNSNLAGGGQQQETSGFSLLPPEIQAALKGVATQSNNLLGPNGTANGAFKLPDLNTGAQTALGQISNQAFAPTAANVNANMAMQQNPYDQSVIDTYNREAAGQGSQLNSYLTNAGQFGSNRGALSANDIDLSRLQQIGTFKQNEFNNQMNNALTTIPQAQQTAAQGAVNSGLLTQGQQFQNQQAPISALTAYANSVKGLPASGGTQSTGAQNPNIFGGQNSAFSNLQGQAGTAGSSLASLLSSLGSGVSNLFSGL